MSNVCIAGAGYVGLVTGACLAELGHTVVCLETDPGRSCALKRGEIPIHEPGLSDLVACQRRAGRLGFTEHYRQAVPASEFAFIAVNTPPSEDGQADPSFVFAAARSVLEHARPGLVIAIKSTVPVGTGDAIAQLARRSGPAEVEVVSNPEFLRQGSAIRDFLRPNRIVIGAADPAAGAAVAELYAALDAPVIMCSRRSAELAKYAANAFLAARLSLVNELSAICESVQADISEVTTIVGADHRIGPAFLAAGLGWGGSCLPKDVLALAAAAEDNGCDAAMLRAALEVNARQKAQAVERLRAAVGEVAGATVGVLGLAFKPNTDDVRGAPALEIVERLLEAGMRVRAHDPAAMANAQRVLPHIEYCRDAYHVAVGCHAILLATEWPEYLQLDWREIRARMRGRVILDGRNALERRALVGLGFDYLAFGRPPVKRAHGSSLLPEANAAGS